MPVLGYGGGVTPQGRLAEAGAIVFNDMRDLPALITELDAAAGARAPP